MGSSWSVPHYGTQHLSGLRKGFQVTAVDYESFAMCKVFVPGHGFCAKVTKHADANAARAFGEQQARELDALAVSA